MRNRDKVVDAILNLSRNPLSREELFKLSKMSYGELVDKLISISYADKFPIKK